MLTNASIEVLQQVLQKVNEEFKGNVEFKRLQQKGKRVQFTLKVKNSKGPGAKKGRSGRRTISACWHVHGRFIDTLFELAPDNVYVISMNKKYTKETWRWEDFNQGSIIYPVYASELCECE